MAALILACEAPILAAGVGLIALVGFLQGLDYWRKFHGKPGLMVRRKK